MISLSIRRPVAVAMVYFAVALLGISAWRNIPVDQLPDASFPRLTVSFGWRASPETVEAFATSPIEAAIQQVKWVQRVTSRSTETGGSINVEFAREADMNVVRLDLSERLAVLEESLPEGVGTINVTPYIPREFEDQARSPVLRYTFTGPFMLEALYAHLDNVVAPELAKVPGVSVVDVLGGRRRVIELELDPDRIAALGLSPARVASAINALNLVREVGAVRQDEQEWALTIRNRPETVQDLREAALFTSGGMQVRVDDVATIRDTFEEIRAHHRINGSPALSFAVYRERGANTVRVAELVRERVDQLQALNPPGSTMRLSFDQSVQIKRDMDDLRTRALIAACVIFGVLLLFLRSFRTAAIVFLTIAFSILIALNLVYLRGMTLNILTMMGMALGFGLIVDNSIVVLENIYRKRQEGMRAEDAAAKGARDVVMPIIAATMTTLIVFAPFVYFQGHLSVYYMPLAVVVALTLVASLLVAFSFIPALAARILRRGYRRAGDPRHPSSRAGSLEEDATGALTDGGANTGGDEVMPAYVRGRPPFYIRFYAGLLAGTLRLPWVAVLVAAGCFLVSWKVFDTHVSRGQVWGFGSGVTRSFVSIQIRLPRGSDLERVDQLTRYFEDRLARMPEVSEYTANVSGTNGRIRVEFPEELEFTAVPLVIEEQLRAYSLGFTGATVRVFGQGPSFGVGGGATMPRYRVTLLGYNFERLAEIADDLGARLRQHSRVTNVDTNAALGAGFGHYRDTEFAVTINREAASLHGLSSRDVASMVQSAVRTVGSGGRTRLGGEDVQFDVKLTGFRRLDVHGLLDMVVATPSTPPNRVRLGDLVTVEERPVMSIITREDQQYSRTVAYEFRGPAPLGNVINRAAVDATVLPPGYSVQDRTPWRISAEDQRQLRTVLIIAVILVFMVTASIFESIRQPLCVLLAVPMALIGVFLIFFYLQVPFNREAHIGVIMMGGIVVNNAILLVDHINRVRRETTLGLHEAIIRGTLERVRPILMTTTTTVCGLLPLVLLQQAGSTIWSSLTYSLIGGLLSSTLFVLTTTPALYLLFERLGAAFRGEDLSAATSR